MGMGNWFQKNPSAEDLNNVRKSLSSGRVMRFFLRIDKQTQKGESRQIIILDDEPFCVQEHNPVINGEFHHYFTCRRGVDDKDPSCPLCLAGERRVFTGYITILDATGYESKKNPGQIIKYSRQLFPMTLSTLDRFRVLKDRKTSLVGAVLNVTRTSSNAVKVGDMWELEGIVDPFMDKEYWYESKIQKKMVAPEPFDYMKILEPLSSLDMRALGVSGREDKKWDYNSDGGGSNNATGGGDDDQTYY